MGTKNEPGRFDCYNAALPDEPMFTLLARDPLAAFLVSLWAAMRVGDVTKAQVVFSHMVNLAPAYAYNPDTDKAREASHCSATMFAWRRERHGDAPGFVLIDGQGYQFTELF